jgi:hypothetical protein
MSLGIAVVYLVSERNEKLLDLHLRQIERYTEAPYTIYAGVNGLLPRFREKLETNPHVKICPCEPYVPGSGLCRQDRDLAAQKGLAFVDSKYEHSWYLEQLIHTALADGVSHVATLHVDSFPVRAGWDAELMSRLSDRCVLASIVRDPQTDRKPLTACILFSRAFFLRYQPRLLLSQEELDSADYARYREACPHSGGSGVGYGFKIFLEGLTWHPMVRSNPGGHHLLFASIYDDLIFHLHAAAVVEQQQRLDYTVRPSQRGGLIGAAARAARLVLPEAVRGKIRRRVAPRIQARLESTDRDDWERQRQRLLDDPDRYLTYLRSGRPEPVPEGPALVPGAPGVEGRSRETPDGRSR